MSRTTAFDHPVQLRPVECKLCRRHQGRAVSSNILQFFILLVFAYHFCLVVCLYAGIQSSDSQVGQLTPSFCKNILKGHPFYCCPITVDHFPVLELKRPLIFSSHNKTVTFKRLILPLFFLRQGPVYLLSVQQKFYVICHS